MLKVHCATHRPIELAGTGIGVLQVGDHVNDFGDHRDNSGDNISVRNNRFSELTGFYYVWKNQPSEAVGFCHYRRYLIPSTLSEWLVEEAARPYADDSVGGVSNYASGHLVAQSALAQQFVEVDYPALLDEQLQSVDILLPKSNKLPVGGFLQQYGNAHPVQPFFECLALMAASDNKLARDAHRFFTQHPQAHWNNLFATHWHHFSDYCEFVFEILLALDDKLAPMDDVYQNRICAFLSERLFNFWVWHRRLKVKELDWCMTEDMSHTSDSHQRKRSARNIARDAQINAAGGSNPGGLHPSETD